MLIIRRVSVHCMVVVELLGPRPLVLVLVLVDVVVVVVVVVDFYSPPGPVFASKQEPRGPHKFLFKSVSLFCYCSVCFFCYAVLFEYMFCYIVLLIVMFGLC